MHETLEQRLKDLHNKLQELKTNFECVTIQRERQQNKNEIRRLITEIKQ